MNTTDGSNLSFAGISTAPSVMTPANARQFSQALQGALARFIADEWAVNTVGGTGDAITVTATQGWSAYATGQGLRFVAGAANTTTSVTLNVNSIGAKAVRKISGGVDVALAVGDLVQGETYTLIYRASANSSAGGWVVVGLSVPVAQATTSTAGTVKLATNAQAEVGTDTAAALTSSNLAALLNAGTDNSGGATITMGDGGYFNLITSTTTITAFAFTNDAVGRTARIRFNTVRTLTYNATSLILPGAANITTAVGDIMQIRSLGSGNFVVEWYNRASAPAAITLGASTASTSGTSIDYTSIPSGVRRIVVTFIGTSLSGSANFLIQIGSGSVDTSSYVSGSSQNTGSSVGSTSSTAGFIINVGAASNALSGTVILCLQSPSANSWSASHAMGFTNQTGGAFGGGSHSLSGAIDRVRITTTNGTDTFDAGSVNISYEF